MSEFCSCGAELPPDALFCHKCGKPQQELGPQGEDLPVQRPVEPVVLQAPALNFRNPVAVRVGFSVGSLAALLSWLPLLNLGFVIWWLAAGFFSVYLYRRRTGALLTVSSGVRIGWITGVLTFAIMAVLFTLSLIPLALSSGGLAAIYQEQLRNMPMQDPNMEQALRLFQTPAGIATILMFTLVLFFGIITFLCTAGGALGAKIVGRD